MIFALVSNPFYYLFRTLRVQNNQIVINRVSINFFVSHQCSATAGSIMVTVGVHYGFGQKVGDLNATIVPKVIMFDYLIQTFGLAGGALGRVSFIVFIIGLLGAKMWHRIILWVLVGMQVVINSLFIIILFVQCPGHASAIWEHADKAKCWNTRVQAYYGYFQGCEENPFVKTHKLQRTNMCKIKSVQLSHGSISRLILNYHILELELETTSQIGVSHVAWTGNIVSSTFEHMGTR